MKHNENLSLVYDWFPGFVVLILGLLAILVSLIEPLKQYIINSTEFRNILQLSVFSIILAALLRINLLLRNIKNDGLPIPASYNASANIEMLVKKNKSSEMLIIYIGYLDEQLFPKTLLSNYSNKENIKFIFGMDTLKFLMRNYSWVEITGNKNGKIFVSMLPVDTICAVHSSQGECTKISIIKRYVNGAGSYALELSPHRGFLNEISHSMKQTYLTKCISTSNKCMLNFIMDYYNESSLLQRFLDDGEKIKITHRGEFFDRCASLIKYSRNTLKAIDMTPIENWVNDIEFYYYLESHRESLAKEKLRLKVFNPSEIKSNLGSYELYIEKMISAGVTLSFLEEEIFNSKDYPKQGLLLVDDEVSVRFIKPDKGSKFGELDFSDRNAKIASRTFDDLSRFALSHVDFTKKYLIPEQSEG